MSDKFTNHHPIPIRSATIPTVIGWIIIIAYFIVSIAFVGYSALTPLRYYKKAIEYYHQGDYESAHNIVFAQSNHIPLNYYNADYRESRLLGIKIAEKGDEVYFGEYSNKKLKWIVIDKNPDGYIRLMCKDVVGQEDYENSGIERPVKWNDSHIKSWLNNTFYNSAFSESQKTAIIETYDKKFECYETVSILSYSEVQYYETQNYGNFNKIIDEEDIWLKGNSVTRESDYYWTQKDKTDECAPRYCNGVYKELDIGNSCGVRPIIWIDPSKVTEV